MICHSKSRKIMKKKTLTINPVKCKGIYYKGCLKGRQKLFMEKGVLSIVFFSRSTLTLLIV